MLCDTNNQWRAEYPENRYLTVVGLGYTETEAKQTAIEDIADYFQNNYGAVPYFRY